MTSPTPDPDEPGTLSSRERAVLADIETGLAANADLAERMACGRGLAGFVREWAGQIPLLALR